MGLGGQPKTKLPNGGVTTTIPVIAINAIIPVQRVPRRLHAGRRIAAALPIKNEDSYHIVSIEFSGRESYGKNH
jgi:hypothetical protein